jgi:hypothetical protein
MGRGDLQQLDHPPVREPVQVFVDTSGRRRTRLHLVVTGTVLACGGFVTALGVGFGGGLVGPDRLLPWVAGPTTATAHSRPVSALPGRRPGETLTSADTTRAGRAASGVGSAVLTPTGHDGTTTNGVRALVALAGTEGVRPAADRNGQALASSAPAAPAAQGSGAPGGSQADPSRSHSTAAVMPANAETRAATAETPGHPGNGQGHREGGQGRGEGRRQAPGVIEREALVQK